MRTYQVRWSIAVDAKDPLDAAKKAANYLLENIKKDIVLDVYDSSSQKEFVVEVKLVDDNTEESVIDLSKLN